MILEKTLLKWFDEYEIKARLLPAIIASLPFLFLTIAVPPNWLPKAILLVGEVVILAALCKALMGMVQAAGNSYQTRIIKEWDGLPTTRYLRRSDTKYTLEFKQSMARKTQSMLGINLDIENEQSIETAISAIKTYLHNNDKHKKWRTHNIDYGLHRNLSGLRAWIILCHLTAGLIYATTAYLKIVDFSVDMVTLWLIIAGLYILIALFSPRSCETNAEHYAEKLIMTFYETKHPKELATSLNEGRQKMSKDSDRTVYKRDDGQWVNKRNDADKPSSVHRTQKEANQTAREMLKNQGGGELTTKGRDGKIVSKDTISPGKDSCPPKDQEH